MKLLRYFIRDMKLRNKLLVTYTLLVAIPMLVIFWFFQLRFVNHLEESTLEMETVIVAQVAGGIENYISQAAGIAEEAAKSSVLQSLLGSRASALEIELGQQSQRDRYITWLSNLSAESDGTFVRAVKIYCEGESALFAWEELTQNGIFVDKNQISTSLWYGNFQMGSEQKLLASAFWLNSWEIETLGQIVYVQRVPYYDLGVKKEAYVAVYCDQSYLEEQLEGYGNYSESMIYLVDEKEGIVGMFQQGNISNTQLEYRYIDSILPEENVFLKVDYGAQDAWSIFRNIQGSNWKLVFTISEDSILSSVQADRAVFMRIYVMTAVLLYFLVFLMAKTITDRITLLKKTMRQVQKAPRQNQAFPMKRLKMAPQKDEIGELTASYNHMADTINRLMEERVLATRERNQMEMNALRAQINPHFLYNTLDMISWLAQKGETQEVSRAVHSLARFYKLSLNNGEAMTTLEAELELLERYVEIQNQRTDRQIELLIDVPEEMMGCRILQFVLQPLAENSLKHGIMERKGQDGHIIVTGWMEQNFLILIVADDGIGMSPEQLEQLTAHMQEKTKPAARLREEAAQKTKGHIGVRNIYRRLELFYGAGNFSVVFTSKPGEGTQVELHLPITALTDSSEAYEEI